MTARPVSDQSDILESATHACSQCKASKKKCDKALPSCNRCSKFSIPCLYDDGTGIAPAEIISKFQAVFSRLERLEENVFPSNPVPIASPVPSIESAPTPMYLEVIAGANVFKILEDRSMTLREVVDKHSNTVHTYMPIMSRQKLERQTQQAETFRAGGPFLIWILAILLLTEHPTA
ncbi:hypothetical protein BJX70DRAFT_401038 [Aspergillus crustosus]